MHIPATTHEHGSNAKVYTYEGDFDLQADEIAWKATISEGTSAPRQLSGRVPLSSPAMVPLAEEAVRDDIIKQIDNLSDVPVR
ncbi:MAG TPA: hypothetical protein VGM74_08865 [Burkholderiaceae bacterium]|jgi:hypothetical protein